MITNRSIRSCFSRHVSVEMFRLCSTHRRSLTFHFWRSCRVNLPVVRMLHFLHWRCDFLTFSCSCITQLAQKKRPQSLHSFYKQINELEQYNYHNQICLYMYTYQTVCTYIMQIISVVHRMIYIPARLFHLKYTYGMLVI